jgi:hypothetical protein
MMQTIAVTDAITTIAEAEKRFGLSRSESPDFFPEWNHKLPEINSDDQTNLESLWKRYIYHQQFSF